MDTTVVIEAWTSVITPGWIFAVVIVQSILIGIAMFIGWAMGKDK